MKKRILFILLLVMVTLGFGSCDIKTKNVTKQAAIELVRDDGRLKKIAALDIDVPYVVKKMIYNIIEQFATDYRKSVPARFKELLEKNIEASKEGLTFLDYLFKGSCHNKEDLDGVFPYPYGRNEFYNNEKYRGRNCRIFLLNNEYIMSFLVDEDADSNSLWYTLDSHINFDIYPNVKRIEHGKYIEDDMGRGNMLIEIDDVNEFYVEENTSYICSYIWRGHDNLKLNEYEGCLYLPSKSNPYYAFLEPIDKTLKEYKIHKDTVVVADYAFGECIDVENIIFEDVNTCINIGDYTFYNCENLKTCNFPSSINEIDNSLLTQIPNITLYNDGEASYLGNDDNPYVILVKVTNPSSPEFRVNDNTKIVYSTSFSGKLELTKVVIPDSVTQLCKWAIGGTSTLKEVIIGEGIKRIEKHAIINCLDKIEIKGRNIVFEGNPFVGATPDIYYDGTVNEWMHNYYINPIYSNRRDDLSRLYTKENNIYTFVENLEISCNVPKNAFAYYKHLKDVTFRNGVEVIGSNAFCQTSVRKVEFSNSIRLVEDNAFADSDNLNKFVYNGTIDEYCNIVYESPYANPMIYSISFATKNKNRETKLNKVVIGDSVTKINDYAFINSLYINEFIIGKNVKTIGKKAFYFHNSETSIYVLGELDNVEYYGLAGNLYFESSDVSSKFDKNWYSSVYSITWNYKQ